MTLSDEVRNAGKEVAAATFSNLADQLNAAIGQFVGWPYKTGPGSVIDAQGTKTEPFASVIYAAVIDVSERLDLEGLRAAYSRIAQAQRLKKAPPPRMNGPSTNVTLGISYAHGSTLPLEDFAGEIERLNASTSSEQWPDMMMVANVGAVQYAIQFPGESQLGLRWQTHHNTGTP